MKKMISLKNLFLAIFASAALVSCGDDDNGSGTGRTNLAETLNSNGFTTFKAAADLAGVGERLTGSTKFTVLAPSNSAFDQFLLESGYSSIDAVPAALLREVVLNHFISGDVDGQALVTGYKKTQAKGSASTTSTLSVFINNDGSTIKLNGVSTITTADLRASNGRIHIVDRVVPMPSVYTHIQANPAFSSFAAALQTYSSAQFAQTLSGNGPQSPYTVVVPTNEGMNNILNTLDVDNYSDIPEANLTKVLNYHILSTAKLYSVITDGPYATLAGQNFTVQNTGGGKKITDTQARVANFTGTTTRDIIASNGVIHVIDNGLLPGL